MINEKLADLFARIENNNVMEVKEKDFRKTYEEGYNDGLEFVMMEVREVLRNQDSSKKEDFKNLTFENFNAKTTNEGQLLLAAICILTQTKFKYGGALIHGNKKTPQEIFEFIQKLAFEIFQKK